VREYVSVRKSRGLNKVHQFSVGLLGRISMRACLLYVRPERRFMIIMYQC